MITTITPDTTVYTLHQDAVGYTWQDGMLGDLSPTQYARECASESYDQSVDRVTEWLGGIIGEGYWLTEQDAEEARDGDYHYTIYAFTPREAHEMLMDAAKREAEDN